MIGSLDWYFDWFTKLMTATLTIGFFTVGGAVVGQSNVRFMVDIGVVLLATILVPFLAWPVLALCAHVSRKRRRRSPSLLPPTMKHAERPHVVVVAPTMHPDDKRPPAGAAEQAVTSRADRGSATAPPR
jgi:hypothetical protein